MATVWQLADTLWNGVDAIHPSRREIQVTRTKSLERTRAGHGNSSRPTQPRQRIRMSGPRHRVEPEGQPVNRRQ
jgi:hypothetical protein